MLRLDIIKKVPFQIYSAHVVNLIVYFNELNSLGRSEKSA